MRQCPHATAPAHRTPHEMTEQDPSNARRIGISAPLTHLGPLAIASGTNDAYTG